MVPEPETGAGSSDTLYDDAEVIGPVGPKTNADGTLSAGHSKALDDYVGLFRDSLGGPPATAADVRDKEIIARGASAYPPRDPSAVDTMRRFMAGRDAAGHPAFTPEREALHDAIVRQYLREATPVERPAVVVTGGGPASGKSSLLRAHPEVGLQNAIKIDSDEIRLLLPEFSDYVKGGPAERADAGTFTQNEVRVIAAKIVAASDDYNLVIDASGGGSTGRMARLIERYRGERERPVSARYVTTSIETAQARSRKRSEDPPYREVPPALLEASHRAISRILPELAEQDHFDDVQVWNTESREPVRIMTKERGEPIAVHDDALWEDFLRLGQR